jgi:hypothetical protein
MSYEKLKTCPFCGGDAKLEDEGHAPDSGSEVVCKQCHARSPWFDYYIVSDEAYTSAIEASNARSPQGLVPLNKEKIIEVLDSYTIIRTSMMADELISKFGTPRRVSASDLERVFDNHNIEFNCTLEELADEINGDNQ